MANETMCGICKKAVWLLLAAAPVAQAADWVATWGASPLPPTEAVGQRPGSPSFDDQTVRQIVRISVGGPQLRLRLTNEYGTRPLRIGAATIGVLADDADEPEDLVTVTFAGEGDATIPAGAPLLSDPIDLPVENLARLAIALYLPEETGRCTCHAVGMQTALVAPGDATQGPLEATDMLGARAFLSGVEVMTDDATAIVAFGDSITDGVGSTSGANKRWPDLLAERLLDRDGGKRFGIVNAGISGNRVLADGAGVSALARFDRDVLAVPGVTHVIVFEGVNDVGVAFGNFNGRRPAAQAGPAVDADALIDGYRQLIARAHSKDIEIIGATIAPYEGAGYYSEQGNAVREAVNEWIRSSGEFDAVLDFDAVLRDADKPTQIADGLHSGDFLHGSDAGYAAMAEAIDLSIFD